jgi:hypothetical protein
VTDVNANANAPGWWVTCTDWNGIVVYNGPAPTPPELCTLTVANVEANQFYTFDMTPMGLLPSEADS